MNGSQKINKIVKYFIIADLVLFAGWGFASPIFAVFVVDNITEATLVTVGVASAIYWLARSVIQPPIANALDKKMGERDDIYALLFGLILVSVSAFTLATIDSVNALYLIQILHGASMGVYSVAWSAVFSRHLDKGRYAFDWSLDRSSIGIAIAVTSFGGGEIASRFGFDTTFIIAGVMSLVSAAIIFFVPNLLFPLPKERPKLIAEIGGRHRDGAQFPG